MIVGALRLIFATVADGSSSHQLAHKIKDHLWARYKVSVAELPSPSGNEILIGVSLVGGEMVQTKDRMNQIVNHLQNWGEVDLIDHEMEVLHYEDIETERDFEKYNP